MSLWWTCSSNNVFSAGENWRKVWAQGHWCLSEKSDRLKLTPDVRHQQHAKNWSIHPHWLHPPSSTATSLFSQPAAEKNICQYNTIQFNITTRYSRVEPTPLLKTQHHNRHVGRIYSRAHYIEGGRLLLFRRLNTFSSHPKLCSLYNIKYMVHNKK